MGSSAMARGWHWGHGGTALVVGAVLLGSWGLAQQQPFYRRQVGFSCPTTPTPVAPAVDDGAAPERSGAPVAEVLGKPVYVTDGEGDEVVSPIVSALFGKFAVDRDLTGTTTEMNEYLTWSAERRVELVEELKRDVEEARAPPRSSYVEAGFPDPALERIADLERAAKAFEEAPTEDVRAYECESAARAIRQWKINNALYDEFGGGRVVFQQFGPEALDATRRFLQEEEERGSFKIMDSRLRANFWAYYDGKGHQFYDPMSRASG